MEKKDEIIALNVNVSLLGYDSERKFYTTLCISGYTLATNITKES